jgi:sugar phosphate isomerase/epimerase
VYVACSTLCFSRLSLEGALQAIREMHFAKGDLTIHADGPHLTPTELAQEPGRVAQRLKAANLPLAAIHLECGTVAAAVAREQLRLVARLARVSSTPLITLSAAPRGFDFDAEVNRLRELVKIASSEGVMLAVETHSQTITAEPLGAVELCRRVPGLGLSLDPSHYCTGVHGPLNYDALYPHVCHVRLRDSGAGPDQFQVRVGQGEIEYGRLISQLERVQYNRALCVDIRDVADCPFPVEPEVRKLKYLLESLV